MFWIDVLLSLALPFVFCGLIGGMMAIFMHRAVTPEAVNRIRAKNSRPGHTPSHWYDGVKPHAWESPLDAEIQRLKRKSLGQ
ncbi:MAG TPA: hypothetical protein VFX19_03350 [Dehalococcoidia bacterium]|nr:hypothetical protein [Dehalococcoidia bacterium]